jgi:hypothetical protein
LLATLPVLIALVVYTVLIAVVEYDRRTVATTVGLHFLVAYNEPNSVSAGNGEVEHKPPVGADRW